MIETVDFDTKYHQTIISIMPTMETREKAEQVKAYISAMQNPRYPYSRKQPTKRRNGVREVAIKSSSGLTKQAVQQVCSLTEMGKMKRDGTQKTSSSATRLYCQIIWSYNGTGAYWERQNQNQTKPKQNKTKTKQQQQQNKNKTKNKDKTKQQQHQRQQTSKSRIEMFICS